MIALEGICIFDVVCVPCDSDKCAECTDLKKKNDKEKIANQPKTGGEKENLVTMFLTAQINWDELLLWIMS